LGEKKYNQNIEFYKKTYPEKNFCDLEVHHIDGNKFNFDPKNLAIISVEEHSKINHKQIWDSNTGNAELKRLSIQILSD
jgi:alkyl hydroperoxide reductase subunit AhpC